MCKRFYLHIFVKEVFFFLNLFCDMKSENLLIDNKRLEWFLFYS